MLIYVTLFTSGAVVMSLEILAGRQLATAFGESLYTWGAAIGTFIGALSAGYWAGGAAADRWPSRTGLAVLALASGVLIICVVSVTQHTTDFIAGLGMPEKTALWAEPLLAVAILYALPVFFLGAVSPWCVRIAARDLSGLGRKVGRLYAISSLGSIFGTFFTAFYLVAELGTRMTIRAQGVLLIVLSVVLFAALLGSKGSPE